MRKARSAAREIALNVLYQWDAAGVPFEEALETALEFVDLSDLAEKTPAKADEAREYARQLARGTQEHLAELDSYISDLAHGWPPGRQPAVDRNVLRIAIYEIHWMDSVPPVVAVNEAVELAKRFSTAESGKFVNGVLAGFLRREEKRREEDALQARLLDGAALAKEIRAGLVGRVESLKKEKGITPRLAVILVGGDPASVTYTRMKKKACEAAGMLSDLIELPEDSTQQQVKDVIQGLNDDSSVHGILVQHPVPGHLDELDILSTVAVEKDVDGISAISLGRLVLGTADYVACTPLGIVRLLEHYDIPIKGAQAVVIGRSIILGKPAALALLERHATVTICHSRTQDLAEVVGRADIIVAAIGKAELIKGSWIKPGAVVVDAGYNKVEGRDKDVGDVEFEVAAERASYITPVPGGVGPMTIAMLLEQTVEAATKYG